MDLKIISFDKKPFGRKHQEYYIQIDIDGFLYTGFLKKKGEIEKG